MSRNDAIRKEILFQLYAVRPLSVSPERIARDAAKQGYDYSAAEIRAEGQFLSDEGLIIRIHEPGTTSVMLRIGSAGVRQYEELYAS